MSWDCVIIGCGLSGMVVARSLADQGKKILILEKRNHIGGNIFDEYHDSGILIQKYGPHSFFTNDENIRPYIEQFIETEDCFVECKTVIDGKKIPMPFNFESIDLIYPLEHAERLKNELKECFKGKEMVSVTDLLESGNEIIVEYGQYMYEKEYCLYTAKQWGRDITTISPEIFKRVPVYLSNRKIYQSHEYQFVPKGGFTKLAQKMLDHNNITLRLNCDVLIEDKVRFADNKMIIELDGNEFHGTIVYTGEIDALFDYQYGTLPYRSLEFIEKVLAEESYQDTAIVAYPQADKITRVTEYKKLPTQDIKGKTLISIEIPYEYDRNMPVGNEPYYPIKNDETDQIYKRYFEKSEKIYNLYLVGRLADYKYYNMDMVINRALEVADNILLTLN